MVEQAVKTFGPRWSLVWAEDGREQTRPIRRHLRIGRAGDNDLVLTDPHAADHVCRFVTDAAGRLHLEALDGGELTVNDLPVSGRVGLRPGDAVRAGAILFRVWGIPASPDDQVAAPVGREMAIPVARADVGWLATSDGRQYSLRDEHLIGRGAQCDIRLNNGTVSRYHALLRQVNERWVLSDLGSSNGTRVNDRPLRAAEWVRPGDRLSFGEAELVFMAPVGPDGVSTPGGVLAVSTTPHFRIAYVPDSFAEGQLATIEGRLEAAHALVSGLLGVAPPAGSAPIGVILADILRDPQHPDTPLTSGGYVDLARRALHEVYRADAPGSSLEMSVFDLLLADAAPTPPPGWSPALVAGLRMYTLERLAGTATNDEEAGPLSEAARRRELPSIRRLLAGADGPDRRHASIALAAFLGDLERRHGADTLRRFLGLLAKESPDAAAQAAFGSSLASLERTWRRDLRKGGAGGVGRFVAFALGEIGPYRLRVVGILLYTAVIVAFGIFIAKMQGVLLDRALIAGDRRALATIMGALVAFFIIATLASLRQDYLVEWVSGSVSRSLRLRMFARLQELQPGFFQRMTTGDILARMTSEIDMIQQALSSACALGVQLALTLVTALVVILIEDWRLAVLAVAALPLFFVVGRYLDAPIARASAARQRDAAEVTGALQENLGAQAVVKAFGLQDLETRSFVERADRLLRSSIRMTFLTSIFGVSIGSIATAVQLTVLGVGGWLVVGGDLTAGALFTFLALMGQIIGPIQGLSGVVQVLQQTSGAAARVSELLGTEPAIRDAAGARRLDRVSGVIRFDAVTFGYDAARPILRGLTLDIPAGANVALVGPSGCGKSTLLNLLLRFYDPSGGRVLFDGVDLREAQLESVRAQIGVVLQESVLFDTTIRENIRRGKPGATDDDVEAAARAAEIHDLILGLPEGYDTVVGERGGRLSGGQRQRVALARAIIRDPAILLLDEATSALDPQTEAAINDTLGRMARGRTMISVTHRLASVVHADQIYVFDAGRLVEQGTHDELVQWEGLYARLWRDQHGGATPTLPEFTLAGQLRRIPLFAQLDPDLLDAVAGRLTHERFAQGDPVIVEGGAGDRFFVVGQGQLEVTVAGPNGEERCLAILREGDYFGEIALLYDLPRTATVRARTSAQLSSLGREDFYALLATAPGVREALEQAAAARRQGAAEIAS